MGKPDRTYNCGLHSPTIHLLLYGFLLVFTPLLLLQNYLQQAIGSLSEFHFRILSIELPLILVLALICLVLAVFILRKRITFRRSLAFLAIVLMLGISQRISDFYLGKPFYDLQNNWHYIAYAIYAFFAVRFVKSRGKTGDYLVRFTYFSALALSAFDEGFQYFISSRVFDIGDIAKDGWGALIGLVALFFIFNANGIAIDRFSVRKKECRNYWTSGSSMLFLSILFNLQFLFFSSTMTDIKYLPLVVIFTVLSFVVLFIMIHFTIKKPFRIAMIILLVLLVSGLSISHVRHRKGNIVYHSSGLTVYRGIPIPFFDFIVSSNGFFRFVDRKEYFTPGDIDTILKQKTNIAIVGSGADGAGGKGFNGQLSQLVYNRYTGRCTQITVLPTSEACEYFNGLKKVGKDVLLVVHNKY